MASSEFHSILKTTVLILIAWCSTTPRVPEPDLRSFLPGHIFFLLSPVQHWIRKGLLFTALHLLKSYTSEKQAIFSISVPSSCSDQWLFTSTAHTDTQSQKHMVYLGFTGFNRLAPILPNAGVTGCEDQLFAASLVPTQVRTLILA